MISRVVMFSGGIGSWAAARRVADAYGTAGMVLLFADTRTEDADLYRFIEQAAAELGVELTTIADGRDVWQVFRDKRFLGNSRIDPCSRILKRELMRAWLDAHHDPASSIVYLGMDWTEQHRFDRALHHWAPWAVEAPMMQAPYLEKAEQLAWLRQRGIEPPALYAMGFPHNNCGGFCVKAGISQFVKLYEVAPERYLWHEQQEQDFRAFVGKDVAILTDRAGGEKKPLTMLDLRQRIEAGQSMPMWDWGACACLEDPAEDT